MNYKKIFLASVVGILLTIFSFQFTPIASATPNSDQIEFFTELDYNGQSFIYKVGDEVDLYNEHFHNDDFDSVLVGDSAKVIGFVDDSFHGAQKEYTEDTLDLDLPENSGRNQLSSFVVRAKDTNVIKFTFEDYSQGSHCLTLQEYLFGQVTDCKNDDIDFPQVVGTIDPNSGLEIVTAEFVRNSDGVYEDDGSIYFEWSDASGEVEINEDDSQYSDLLTYEKESPSTFHFFWEAQ